MQRTRAHTPGLLVWFTGLSGAGKSTLARAVHGCLVEAGHAAELLDADSVRPQRCAELGFSRRDREENVRRMAYVASLLTGHGVIALVAAMSPYRAGREAIRAAHSSFLEVFVDAPLALYEERDPVRTLPQISRGTDSESEWNG